MKAIRVSATAERDLEDIWHYVAANSGSFAIADHLIDSITDAFALFARGPGEMRSRPGVRGFPVGNYIVYYVATARSVVIAPVLHGMRDQHVSCRKRR